LSTAYDSLILQYHKVQHAFDGGSALDGVIGILQMLILFLPAIGLVATFWLVFRRGFGSVWSRTEGKPAARGAFVVVTAALAAFLGYIWWPNGDYRPIQRGERGTISGAVSQFENVSSGRPGLTKERARQLKGAPLTSSRDQQRSPAVDKKPAGTISTPTTTSESTTTSTTTTTQTTTEQTTTTTATTTTSATP
jgi:hypothetical protein